MTKQYSIKDLEKLSGIKAHTIRIWEKRYQLLNPLRSDTNIRYYTDQDLKHILDVSLLQQNGLKISKISKLTSVEIKDELESFYQKNTTIESQFDAHIVHFVKATIDLDELAFEHHFSNAVLKFGLEKTFHSIVFPFMVRIGMLWTVNDVHPGHEHFVSNLVKQKLFSAIDGVPPARHSDEKYLLYLTESELHELSLLFLVYLLKSRGKEVVYLGQSTPFSSLKAVVSQLHPTHLVTFFATRKSLRDLPNHIERLQAILTNQVVYISVESSGFTAIETPDNIRIVKDLNDFFSIM